MRATEGSNLRSAICDFLSVLHKCYSETTYSEDRNVYARDIAFSVEWLLSFEKGNEEAAVIKSILSSETEKYFTNYWRQGEFGELELRALKDLKSKVASAL